MLSDVISVSLFYLAGLSLPPTTSVLLSRSARSYLTANSPKGSDWCRGCLGLRIPTLIGLLSVKPLVGPEREVSALLLHENGF